MDPFVLAARQIELDRWVGARFRELLERKRLRLQASPFGFLRGSAPLFYEVLAGEPAWRLEGGGRGAVVGDMHLENVGAYRSDSDDVVFDLNDFDDAADGPFWLDTLRVTTSVIVAGHTLRATGREAIALGAELLEAYDETLVGAAMPSSAPRCITELCRRASRRTRAELLDKEAPRERGKRRFPRGERYLELDAEATAALPDLVAAYRTALGDHAPKLAPSWRIRDAAQRVAGSGSLGRRRIALLLEEEDGTEKLYELKEALPAALEALGGTCGTDPAERVVASARRLLEAPPRQLAALPATALGSFIGRKLCPEEDKLDLAELSGADVARVVRAVGATLGAAHRRAADFGTRGSEPPTPADRGATLDLAVRMAGVIEATYLAYARLT